ncbi:MAG: antitoxin component YwqK of YwqJK toxin-antitoxin module [Chitinophagales bacterium]|jgi:antitoxin component YwqK of YwqJK toxin-antitoxin module
MKHLLIIAAMFFGFSSLQAQQEIREVNKNTVLQNIDKNSDLAFVYLGDVLIEKGVLVNGNREGVWQSFNENGTLATEASFSKGMKNGVWNIYEGAELKYVLHYQNNSRVHANHLALIN